MGSKVYYVGFRNPLSVGFSDSRCREKDSCVPSINCSKNKSYCHARTRTKEGNLLRIDIVSGLKIIQTATQVRHPIDNLVPVFRRGLIRLNKAYGSQPFWVPLE